MSFWNWLKYQLHLTDWKQEKLIITYFTHRDSEARLEPTEFKVLPKNTQTGNIDSVMWRWKE